MLIDLESSPRERNFQADICILGAGVAGLTLATRLAAHGFKVHLLEAGGIQLESRSQALYEVEQAGTLHSGATEGRFRVFGGSSTRWGGQLLPYTEDVLHPLAPVPSAPWPLSADALEPYYPEILRIMGIPPKAAALPFEAAGLLHALGKAPVDLGESIRLRYSKWAPFSRRNLARSLGRACLADARINVFLHANALAVETSGAEATAVRVRNYAGQEFRFSARHIVVALGTIETSRLLLNSRVSDPHDQLGRYFHDHVGIRCAGVDGPAREQLLRSFGPFFVEGVLHTAKLEAAFALRQRETLPAVMAHFVIEEPEDSGVGAVRTLLRAAQRSDLRSAARAAPAVLRGLGDVGRLFYASRVQGRRALSARAQVYLHIDMEQIATSEHRIRLGDSLDIFGQPRAVVQWSVGEPERTLARRFAPVVRDALEHAGISPLQWLPGIFSGDPTALLPHDTFHPMGGVRMGDDPAASVVTPELALHGLPNLHVASCATFPSGGSSNPTFTLMALALRLADRLARS